MNIDTDLQFAYTEGIRDYMGKHVNYLKSQIGNPEGPGTAHLHLVDDGERHLPARLDSER